MTLRVYRRRPGETGSPDPASEAVTVTSVDSEQACGDALRVAVTGAWPPCRCPQHRNQPNKTLTGGA
ncbi:hypothetical protein AAHZ94_22805 [Streptomyces sp. HSW2009]|uniref:hypothetical protein n=1 Tax=Streptomyces sp. HSW2009 TaxID=3142890 RepID=UPI0032ECE6B4